ncbi:L,D-transpeptidase family protein [Sphingomonas sp. So64.6b]|uniref:L,D-transpeptidase family protein n=1 Tax=Sphingomonas sp. So64.6b TaxID=2997354 RepID=UPI0016046620|nr:L,D-transpeptidase family protein [Sphingomonas sp. So64.6b]QNA83562.1 L,D-transpeptidase family protein [Sphingomonas sp. So64.6b]
MSWRLPFAAGRKTLGVQLITPLLFGAALFVGTIGLIAAPSPATTAAPKPAPAQPVTPTPVPKAAATPAPVPVDTRFVVKRILAVEGPMRQGDSYWDESGAPAGPIVVTIDLAAQTLSVFRAGYEIGTAVIIYGADEKPTPLGIFPITQKDADHVSNLYDAPMPYMLRLTNDGISIHGSKVGDGFVTHGCVGIPTAFAKKLFGVVKLGDKVIVTRGELLNLGDAITAA